MLKQFPDTYQVVDYPSTGNPPTGTVWLLRTPGGWAEKRSDGVVQSVSPTTSGQSLDLNAIKANSSGFWLGGTLSGGPNNAGSEGAGCWTYKGDATTGQMSIVVWSAPSYRPIEGSWVRSRTAGAWGTWTVAPKAGDFQNTTGNRDVYNGESWNVANGHVVTLQYLGATSGNIKLKPVTTWANVPQPLGTGVPAKPTSGSDVVEYKYNPTGPKWDVVTPPVDPIVPLTARVTANETTNATQQTDIDALKAAIALGNNRFAREDSRLYTANEAIPVATFVHIRRADSRLAIAKDTTQDLPANGYVPDPVAVDGTTLVYGSGAKYTVTDLGLVGAPMSGVHGIYLGEDGKPSLSSASRTTGRYLQRIGTITNGVVYLDFADGTWIAPL
jgi:hypothetical protein